MTSTQVRVRSVLDAPRGARFTRVPAPRRKRETEPGPFPPRKPRGRHRAPRRWRNGWAATLTYGMALAAGMGIGQVAALFL